MLAVALSCGIVLASARTAGPAPGSARPRPWPPAPRRWRPTALLRAEITASRVDFSKSIAPFTAFTRLGIRSCRRLSCTSICFQPLATWFLSAISRCSAATTQRRPPRPRRAERCPCRLLVGGASEVRRATGRRATAGRPGPSSARRSASSNGLVVERLEQRMPLVEQQLRPGPERHPAAELAPAPPRRGRRLGGGPGLQRPAHLAPRRALGHRQRQLIRRRQRGDPAPPPPAAPPRRPAARPAPSRACPAWRLPSAAA